MCFKEFVLCFSVRLISLRAFSAFVCRSFHVVRWMHPFFECVYFFRLARRIPPSFVLPFAVPVFARVLLLLPSGRHKRLFFMWTHFPDDSRPWDYERQPGGFSRFRRIFGGAFSVSSSADTLFG